MIQQDYILRLIEQLAKCLAGALKKSQAHDEPGALEEIEDAFSTLIGCSSSLAVELPAPSVAAMLGLRNNPGLGALRCLAAAQMLKARAAVLRAAHRHPEARQCDQAAANLFETARPFAPLDQPAVQQIIEELQVTS